MVFVSEGTKKSQMEETALCNDRKYEFGKVTLL